MRYLIALLVLASTATAGDLTGTWGAPTSNCDDTVLEDLSGFNVRWGLGAATVPSTATTYSISGLPPGNWWIQVSAFNEAGTESQYVTAFKTITPEEFVTKSNRVYTFFRSNGNISTVLTSHTVPLGVVCDATQSVNGKYKVPLDSVVWMGTKLTAALADCG